MSYVSISKCLLMVVSKQWLEFRPEIKFPYPCLLTSIEPTLHLNYLTLTSFLTFLKDLLLTSMKPLFVGSVQPRF